MNIIGMVDKIIGYIMAFIPEGILVAIALILMIIARRIRSKNILPKGLSTIKTPSYINILCSNKTGTLTENKIVTTICFINKRMPINKALRILSGNKSQSPPLDSLYQASILCNDTSFVVLIIDYPVLQYNIQGNTTDSATLKVAESAREGLGSTINNTYPRVFQNPFNSKNK
jgi:sodium/potassium-transporting ATPase subunit alpha